MEDDEYPIQDLIQCLTAASDTNQEIRTSAEDYLKDFKATDFNFFVKSFSILIQHLSETKSTNLFNLAMIILSNSLKEILGHPSIKSKSKVKKFFESDTIELLYETCLNILLNSPENLTLAVYLLTSISNLGLPQFHFFIEKFIEILQDPDKTLDQVNIILTSLIEITSEYYKETLMQIIDIAFSLFEIVGTTETDQKVLIYQLQAKVIKEYYKYKKHKFYLAALDLPYTNSEIYKKAFEQASQDYNQAQTLIEKQSILYFLCELMKVIDDNVDLPDFLFLKPSEEDEENISLFYNFWYHLVHHESKINEIQNTFKIMNELYINISLRKDSYFFDKHITKFIKIELKRTRYTLKYIDFLIEFSLNLIQRINANKTNWEQDDYEHYQDGFELLEMIVTMHPSDAFTPIATFCANIQTYNWTDLNSVMTANLALCYNIYYHKTALGYMRYMNSLSELIANILNLDNLNPILLDTTLLVIIQANIEYSSYSDKLIDFLSITKNQALQSSRLATTYARLLLRATIVSSSFDEIIPFFLDVASSMKNNSDASYVFKYLSKSYSYGLTKSSEISEIYALFDDLLMPYQSSYQSFLLDILSQTYRMHKTPELVDFILSLQDSGTIEYNDYISLLVQATPQTQMTYEFIMENCINSMDPMLELKSISGVVELFKKDKFLRAEYGVNFFKELIENIESTSYNFEYVLRANFYAGNLAAVIVKLLNEEQQEEYFNYFTNLFNLEGKDKEQKEEIMVVALNGTTGILSGMEVIKRRHLLLSGMVGFTSFSNGVMLSDRFYWHFLHFFTGLITALNEKRIDKNLSTILLSNRFVEILVSMLGSKDPKLIHQADEVLSNLGKL